MMCLMFSLGLKSDYYSLVIEYNGRVDVHFVDWIRSFDPTSYWCCFVRIMWINRFIIFI